MIVFKYGRVRKMFQKFGGCKWNWWFLLRNEGSFPRMTLNSSHITNRKNAERIISFRIFVADFSQSRSEVAFLWDFPSHEKNPNPMGKNPMGFSQEV